MSEVANKRNLLAAVNALVKAPQPDQHMIIQTCAALSVVINDMTEGETLYTMPISRDEVEMIAKFREDKEKGST